MALHLSRLDSRGVVTVATEVVTNDLGKVVPGTTSTELPPGAAWSCAARVITVITLSVFGRRIPDTNGCDAPISMALRRFLT